MDYLILAVLAWRETFMCGIGDEILWNFDAFTSYPPQLLRLALIIFAETMNLANKMLKGLSIWLLSIWSVIRKKQDLILES